MQPRTPSLLLVLAITFAAPSALAQREHAREAAARASFQSGVRAAEAKAWPEAEAHFATAAELSPNANVWLNLAVARHRMGALQQALTALDHLHALSDAKPERLASGSKLRARIHTETARLVISATPDAAAITVDGVPYPTSLGPSGWIVKAGDHDISVEAEGHVPQQIQLAVNEGMLREVTVALDPIPQEPPADEPPPEEPPAAEQLEERIAVEPPASLSTSPEGSRLALRAGLASATVAAAGLTGLGAWLWSDRERAVGLCEDPPDTPCKPGEQDRVTSERGMAIATTAIAAAATVTFAVVTIWKWRAPGRGVDVACRPTPLGAACSAAGRF